jgi:Mg/Co/Ni transporter MgtE
MLEVVHLDVRHVGLRPALGAGRAVDVTGLVIYFSVATVILRGTLL